jgi:predicted metal-dependent hydrolase
MKTQYPPYTYVPGFWPHPRRDPLGHAFGRNETHVQSIGFSLATCLQCRVFNRGAQLFNAGFYWEAHEAWENIWGDTARDSPEEHLLKALIKYAASAIKLRQGYPEIAKGLLLKSLKHLQCIVDISRIKKSGELKVENLMQEIREQLPKLSTMETDAARPVEILWGTLTL